MEVVNVFSGGAIWTSTCGEIFTEFKFWYDFERVSGMGDGGESHF
jgi:hypothetical protein